MDFEVVFELVVKKTLYTEHKVNDSEVEVELIYERNLGLLAA